jgi:hypothetical protein
MSFFGFLPSNFILAEGVAMTTTCRHCSKSRVNRPRGLCWTCYYTPGIKELYPSTSKFARRGVGNFTGNAPLAPVPTTAVPGTPEKLAVLEHRAKMKLAIFHPADARYEGDPRPLEFLKRQSSKIA